MCVSIGGLLAFIGLDLNIRPTLTTAAPALFAWSNGADAPIARFEAQGGAANGKLYVFGGFSNTSLNATTRSDAYDPATNTWARIADMPEAVTHAGQAVDGNSIYIVGGYLGDNPGPSIDHVWKYALDSDTWTPAPPLPAPRGAGAVVRLGRSLHFFGGATRSAGTKTDTTDHGDHFVLDLDAGTAWTSAAPLPNPRNHLGAVVLDGKIYALGGQFGRDEGSANQSLVDVYDPARDSWSSAPALPLPRGHISASSFVMDGRIFVIGGSANNGDDGMPIGDVVMYDPQSQVWITLPGLPGRRKTPVADVIGDRIVVATGNQGTPSANTWIGSPRPNWEQAEALPVALGDAAGGMIGHTLYMVGSASPATLSYDLSTGHWGDPAALAQRPFPGGQHAAEVVDGKLYLFGGQGSSAGKVQVYDPAANTWSLGADMPFAAAASASALIGGKVYLAGGSLGDTTSAQTAMYDPASNAWATLAPLPQARSSAAAATDGAKLYLFGGRGPGSGDGNLLANGFDTVQVYDPASNAWSSSLDASATLAPLPQGRGGAGKAVYAGGEFYVLGGETLDGAGATAANVYDRVDIYNPRTNLWRAGLPMPTARHGSFPLLIADRIYVAGGGIQAGLSASSLLEVYNILSQADPPLLAPSAIGTATSAPVAGSATQLSTPTGNVSAQRVAIYLPIVIGSSGTVGGSTSTPPTPPASPAVTGAALSPTATVASGEPEATPIATPVATPTGAAPAQTPAPTAIIDAPTATTEATSTQPTATATPSPTRTAVTTSNFTDIVWSTVAPQPVSNSEGQSEVVNGKLYSFGGFDGTCNGCYRPTRRVYRYAPVANSWTAVAPLPKGLTHAGIATDGTNIYLVSGYIENDAGTGQIFGTKKGWRYNVATDTYTPLPDLPDLRAAGALVYLNGKLHYFGGTYRTSTVKKDVGDHYVLDLNGGTQWTKAAPLPNPRHHMGSAVLNGFIYAVGGQHGHDSALVPQDSVHRYDPASDTWTEVAHLPKPRDHIASSTVVMDGRIIAMGGQIYQRIPREILPDVTAYDPQTDTWTELTPLPMPRFSAVAGVINGEIFFSTGNTATTYKGVPILTPAGRSASGSLPVSHAAAPGDLWQHQARWLRSRLHGAAAQGMAAARHGAV